MMVEEDIELNGASGTNTSAVKIKRNKSVILSVFFDFCENAAIDGIQYLTDSGLHWSERLFWVIVVIVSFFSGSYMIYDTYVDFQNSPVLVSFSQKASPISSIPFPAVTFCPLQKSTSETTLFSDLYHKLNDCDDEDFCNITETEQQQYLALSQICAYELLEDLDSPHLNMSLQFDVVGVLDEISLNFSETFGYCTWPGFSDCKKNFKKVITDEGICFTFNSVDFADILKPNNSFLNRFPDNAYEFSEWTMDGGYLPQAKSMAFPLRALGAGSTLGLHIVVYAMEDNMDYLCRGPVQGFNVQIHPPDQLPQVTKSHFQVPNDKEIYVAVQPDMMTTDEDLRPYSPEIRQCFFKDERQLKYFNFYSQSNCEIECLINNTIKQCGCARYSMPVDHDTKICTEAERICYEHAENEVRIGEFEHIVHEEELFDENYVFCNCLPACVSLSFTTDTTQRNHNFDKFSQALKVDNKELGGIHTSHINIFYKDDHFHMSKRSELYGATEFIANCGGLMGLFLGVSVVSFIEIFYYCTLRIFGHKKATAKKSM